MPGDRIALVVGQHEQPLHLDERADAPACLPAPVVPLGELHLWEVALAEGARDRPDRKALQARGERAKAVDRDGQG